MSEGEQCKIVRANMHEHGGSGGGGVLWAAGPARLHVARYWGKDRCKHTPIFADLKHLCTLKGRRASDNLRSAGASSCGLKPASEFTQLRSAAVQPQGSHHQEAGGACAAGSAASPVRASICLRQLPG